jgi:hypothetical protein
MNTKEIWRSIPSHPDYLASSEGRLMRKPFQKPMPHGGLRSYGGAPIIGQWDGERYLLQHKGKTYKVARLVCEAFHGRAPADKRYCLHIDENARNNRPENLKWGTQKENLNAPGFLAYCRGRIGDDSPTIKHRKKQEAA